MYLLAIVLQQPTLTPLLQTSPDSLHLIFSGMGLSLILMEDVCKFSGKSLSLYFSTFCPFDDSRCRESTTTVFCLQHQQQPSRLVVIIIIRGIPRLGQLSVIKKQDSRSLLTTNLHFSIFDLHKDITCNKMSLATTQAHRESLQRQTQVSEPVNRKKSREILKYNLTLSL